MLVYSHAYHPILPDICVKQTGRGQVRAAERVLSVSTFFNDCLCSPYSTFNAATRILFSVPHLYDNTTNLAIHYTKK